MINSMIKIVFLASGGGGNFKFLNHAQVMGIISDFEFYLIADRECGASEYARAQNIPCKVIGYNREYPSELQDKLHLIEPNIIFSNWYKIIDAETVSKYRGMLINLHYSLLPAFGGVFGVRPVELAKAQGCRYVGVTTHIVDEGVDTGKIICQGIVKVEGDFDVPNVVNQLFRKGCKIILNTVLLNSDIEILEKSCDKDFSFSPSLQYNQSLFSEEFWDEIRCL